MKKIAILILGLLLFTGCSSNNTKKEIKINQNDLLQTEYILNHNNDLILEVKNNSQKLLDYINIYIALYDGDKKLIKTKEQFLQNIDIDQENIVKINLSNEEYSSMEISLDTLNYNVKMIEIKNDQVSSEIKEEENIFLDLINNSDASIDYLNGSLVFYKNNKIVDICDVNYQNLIGRVEETISIPLDLNTGKKISYDEVKFILNTAYSYKTN